jgi:calcineurin-like phosphoesterase family protein
MIEGAVDVAVPYRWVNAVGDIIILSHFPDRVTTHQKEEKPEESEDLEVDMIG